MDRHKVKKLRKKIGMTQEQFSIIIGVNRRSVCRWETGEASLPRSTVRLLTMIEMFHSPKVENPDTFAKLIVMLGSIDNVEKVDMMTEASHPWA